MDTIAPTSIGVLTVTVQQDGTLGVDGGAGLSSRTFSVHRRQRRTMFAAPLRRALARMRR